VAAPRSAFSHVFADLDLKTDASKWQLEITPAHAL
jgi:hypothetical protein